MINHARGWLPLGVVSRDAVRDQVSASVEIWSSHWFAKRAFSATRFVERSSGSLGGLEAEPWTLHRGQIAVRCGRAASAALLEGALDTGLTKGDIAQPDRQLLEAFEVAMLQDLVARLELALDVEATTREVPEPVREPFGRLGGLEVAITDGQGPDIVTLAIPLGAILPLIKRSLPKREPRPAPQSRLQALSSLSVKLEATIGKAEVLMADLGSLGPGDVVLLGPARGHLADMSLAGSVAVFAQARLMERDGSMSLVLEAASQ